MKFLRGLFAAVGGLFSIFGHLWGAFSNFMRPVLETFGFIKPQRPDTAAELAEDALDEAEAAEKNRFEQSSSLDRKPVEKWSIVERLDAITRWTHWKKEGKVGPEPSLAGFTFRERMRLKQAKDIELDALIIRYPHEINEWLTGPSPRLKPLTEEQLAQRKPQLDALTKSVEEWCANLERETAEKEAIHNALIKRSNALLGIETDDVTSRAAALLESGSNTPRPRF